MEIQFIQAPTKLFIPCFQSKYYGRVLITQALEPDLVRAILPELRDERCGHSWQPLLARTPEPELFDAVADTLARGRPGRMFTYYCERTNGREGLAIATVSDRITTGFPRDGLPVLGRAFIRRAYRHHQLYSAILSHRLEFCRVHWGSRFLAVHLGASSPPVETTFRNTFDGRAIYVGDEDLGEAGTVRAMLGLTHELEQALATPLARYREQARVMDFLTRGAGATRIADVLPSLNRLAEDSTSDPSERARTARGGFGLLASFFDHLRLDVPHASDAVVAALALPSRLSTPAIRRTTPS